MTRDLQPPPYSNDKRRDVREVSALEEGGRPLCKGKLSTLVSQCINARTPEELALGWLRYEALRTLNPREFAAMHMRNLKGEFFDDIATELVLLEASKREDGQ